MSIQNITLLTAGLINLLMSLYIISRGWRSKINLYFSLLTFFNFLWALDLFLIRNVSLHILFLSKLAYVFALAIVIFLFYFTVHFPLINKKISRINNLLIIIPALVLSCLIFIKNLFIIDFSNYKLENYQLLFNNVIYILYAIYFLIVSTVSLRNLFIKYNNSDQPFKLILGKLFLSITFGLICGLLFNFILPYLGIWHYEWLGPIFTVLMNGYVFYTIFKINRRA